MKASNSYSIILDYINRLQNDESKKMNDGLLSDKNAVFFVYDMVKIQSSKEKIHFAVTESERQELIQYLDKLFNEDFKNYKN